MISVGAHEADLIPRRQLISSTPRSALERAVPVYSDPGCPRKLWHLAIERMVVAGAEKVKADVLERIDDGIRRVEGIHAHLLPFLSDSPPLRWRACIQSCRTSGRRSETDWQRLRNCAKNHTYPSPLEGAVDLRRHHHDVADGADGDHGWRGFRASGLVPAWVLPSAAGWR